MNSETSRTAKSTPPETGVTVSSEARKRSEDKRHPLALRPYLVLWACCLACVLFALISLFTGL